MCLESLADFGNSSALFFHAWPVRCTKLSSQRLGTRVHSFDLSKARLPPFFLHLVSLVMQQLDCRQASWLMTIRSAQAKVRAKSSLPVTITSNTQLSSRPGSNWASTLLQVRGQPSSRLQPASFARPLRRPPALLLARKERSHLQLHQGAMANFWSARCRHQCKWRCPHQQASSWLDPLAACE